MADDIAPIPRVSVRSMREETRTAVEMCLAAVNTEYTADEVERLNRPPYPLPDRLLPHRDVARAEIVRLLREGVTDGTCVLTLHDSYAEEWSALADRFLDERLQFHGSKLFSGALMLMFSAGAMAADEFEAVIAGVPDAIVRNQLRNQLIHVLLGQGEVLRAEQVSGTLEDGWEFFGHRRVALWCAQNADAAGFFSRWPRLAAAKERQHLQTLKTVLVHSVARRHGWRAALDVVADKRIGPKLRSSAFQALAESGEAAQLLAVFSSPDGHDLLTEVEQLEVLAAALAAKATTTGLATREPFTEVLDRIVALDPSDRSVMQARDAMLLRLWPAYPDADALALARKSARTPRIKRELAQGLHPTVTRSEPARG